ncbi:MerR family transcriptional regulator [Kitasatospora sp. RB6PN24]|uniref:MerR family transcriptional regulator n=1 Tax=Kitasatospora humi TaxID=2893891 RepID=UPI001E471E8E|nr:MerR family transcriptional regulator [Kitasatospora humi]MCC9310733.1 MerR family transcriptional regulator [Kitasatospora humi]
MRIGELSKRTGVPIPTIKYYLREGLLPAGVLTSHNQAQYGEGHLRRLKLIRAMTDVGGLSVTATREVLAAMDEPSAGMSEALGVTREAVTPRVTAADGEAWARAERLVDELLARRGWRVEPARSARRALVQLVMTIRDLGQDDLLDLLDEYATAAEQLAEAELTVIGRRAGAGSRVEGAVLGTVLGDAAIGALRRLAQADASHRAFEAP